MKVSKYKKKIKLSKKLLKPPHPPKYKRYDHRVLCINKIISVFLEYMFLYMTVAEEEKNSPLRHFKCTNLAVSVSFC